MTRRSFEQALAKGAMGEALVRSILESKGWVVYQPITDGAHAFDMLSIKDKTLAIAIDVKAKAKMTNYDATGVNLSHFEQYKAFSERHLMPFWIIFVDESMRRIYGNEISELEQPTVGSDGREYPMTKQFKQATRLWAMSRMKFIDEIDEGAAEYLKSASQRSYEYEVQP